MNSDLILQKWYLQHERDSINKTIFILQKYAKNEPEFQRYCRLRTKIGAI